MLMFVLSGWIRIRICVGLFAQGFLSRHAQLQSRSVPVCAVKRLSESIIKDEESPRCPKKPLVP